VLRALKSSALALLAILLLTASLGAKGPPLPYLPEDTAPGAPPREGEAWMYATDSAVARLERIDDAARLAYIEAVTGFRIDPFVAGPTRTKTYVTFRLDLENRSKSVLIFQPLNCRIYAPGQNGWRGPYDLPALQSAFEVFEQEFPPAYAQAAKALFDGEVILNPGEKRSGLLVFPAVDPKWNAYHVEIGWTTADARHEGFEAPYRRPKK
jgi:hypothetical protein